MSISLKTVPYNVVVIQFDRLSEPYSRFNSDFADVCINDINLIKETI